MSETTKWLKLFMQHAPKPWWEVRAQAGGDGDAKVGEVLIYGPIFSESFFPAFFPDDVSPAQLARQIKALGDIDRLNVFINSPGGDAFAGLAINNILRRQKAEVVVHIDGMAASAASVIAMGGDRIVMPANSLFFIHEAWAFAIGPSADMRKMADELDKLNIALVATYQQHATIPAEEIAQMMADEAWINPSEALEMGFATEIEESKQIAAMVRSGKLIVNGSEWDAGLYNTRPPVPDETPAQNGRTVHSAGKVQVTLHQFRDALADALGFQIVDEVTAEEVENDHKGGRKGVLGESDWVGLVKEEPFDTVPDNLLAPIKDEEGGSPEATAANQAAQSPPEHHIEEVTPPSVEARSRYLETLKKVL